MSNAYRNTEVPVSRSQEQIRQMLIKFGARGVQFSEDFLEGRVNVRFGKIYEANIRTVSVTMIIPEPPKAKRIRRGTWRMGKYIPSKSEEQRREQMARATYRSLHDWLKAQFVAIEFGLLSFEDVFLSHFEWMMHDGQVKTTGELLKPHLSTGNLLPASFENADEAEYSEVKD